jgi:hydroxymethylglutaryl-CoA reductase
VAVNRITYVGQLENFSVKMSTSFLFHNIEATTGDLVGDNMITYLNERNLYYTKINSK